MDVVVSTQRVYLGTKVYPHRECIYGRRSIHTESVYKDVGISTQRVYLGT